MGTRQFYGWLNDNALVESYPVDFTNDPFIIAQNDGIMSSDEVID
jgi:acyl-CoA hydrolase